MPCTTTRSPACSPESTTKPDPYCGPSEIVRSDAVPFEIHNINCVEALRFDDCGLGNYERVGAPLDHQAHPCESPGPQQAIRVRESRLDRERSGARVDRRVDRVEAPGILVRRVVGEDQLQRLVAQGTYVWVFPLTKKVQIRRFVQCKRDLYRVDRVDRIENLRARSPDDVADVVIEEADQSGDGRVDRRIAEVEFRVRYPSLRVQDAGARLSDLRACDDHVALRHLRRCDGVVEIFLRNRFVGSEGAIPGDGDFVASERRDLGKEVAVGLDDLRSRGVELGLRRLKRRGVGIVLKLEDEVALVHEAPLFKKYPVQRALYTSSYLHALDRSERPLIIRGDRDRRAAKRRNSHDRGWSRDVGRVPVFRVPAPDWQRAHGTEECGAPITIHQAKRLFSATQEILASAGRLPNQVRPHAAQMHEAGPLHVPARGGIASATRIGGSRAT